MEGEGIMGKIILFVEDEYDRIRNLVRPLEKEGYKIIPAKKDGTEAINILKEKKIDLVILDIMLPPGDEIKDNMGGRRTGLEVCRIIRKELQLDIPIIVLSVIRDGFVRDEIMALGANLYLEKPVLPSILKDRIEELMSSKGDER